MAKPNTPAARPTADGVDPITPAPGATQTPAPNESFTSGAATPPSVNDQSPNQTKEDDTKALPGNGASAEVEMVTVRTKGAYILMDPYSARSIDNSEDGTEVPVTSFITTELAEGGRLEKA